MNESYAECGVSCNLCKRDFQKIGVYFLLLVLSVVASMESTYMLLVVMGVIAFGIMKANSMKYEYEYIFCDGQLDVDKIIANSKRKRMFRVDFDSCEVIAPENSEALAHWNSRVEKVLDYTSHVKGKHTYAIIARHNQQLVKILFEPNENMISIMRNKSRRKVHLD